jgi:hypothetical protein
MNGKYIVNFYPSSMGDSFISHAFPDIKFSIGPEKYSLHNVWRLQNYNWTEEELIDQKIINYFNSGNYLISTHRFDSYDFKKICPTVTIISIDPIGLEESIAIRLNTKTHKNIKNKFYSLNKSTKNKILLSIVDIKKWRKENILDSDIVINLKKLLEEKNFYYDEWRLKNNLIDLKCLNEEFYYWIMQLKGRMYE